MPADLAARDCRGPVTGATYNTPSPGLFGSRLVKTYSRLAPAWARCASLSATPPAWSFTSQDQTCTRSHLKLMAWSLSFVMERPPALPIIAHPPLVGQPDSLVAL